MIKRGEKKTLCCYSHVSKSEKRKKINNLFSRFGEGQGGRGNNTNLSSLKTMVKREKEKKTTLCWRYSSTISAYNRFETRSCIHFNNTYELTDITIVRNDISHWSFFNSRV